LLRRPGVPAVGRGRDGQRGREVPTQARMAAVTSELGVADVNAAEELTGGGIVRPDLVFVLERGLADVRVHDHRRLPTALEKHVLRRRVVEPRDADTEVAVELRVRERKPGWPR